MSFLQTMTLPILVISGFALGILAPALHRVLGDRLVFLMAALPLGMVAYLVYQMNMISAGHSIVFQQQWVPEIGLAFSLTLDGLSWFFALLIAGIGFLVCIYTRGYFAGHQQLGLFYGYILVFMAAMLGLVLASNLLSLYMFWELTTLSSFLLIGFDHQRAAARAAAVQSLLTTALGGLTLLAGLLLLGMAGNSFEISDLVGSADQVRSAATYPAIVVLIALGAFTKSAQFPLHFWLPTAMEAPTPVSAYLHSATMVKAGVYLLMRLLPVLGDTPLWVGLVTTVGAVTMLAGAVLALLVHDLKAILAYLTINVLGTLVMLLGVGSDLAVKAALVYLVAHAFYKGALFLVAGIVDHQTHQRDIRNLGGLRHGMPITTAIALLAALSMAGVIPLFGFVAKEMFLEAVWKTSAAQTWLVGSSVLASSLLVAGAGLAGIRPFFGTRRVPGQLREAPPWLWISPAILALLGLLIGLFPQQLAQPFIAPAVPAVREVEAELHLAIWHGVKPPLVLSLIALSCGVVIYVARDRLLAWLSSLPAWLRQVTGSNGYELVVAGINRVADWQTRVLQSGYLRYYVLTIVVVLVLLLLPLAPMLQWSVLQEQSVGVRFYEAVAALLIIAAASVAVTSLSRLGAIASMGVVGFTVAWIFSLFGAPDLAMTQLVIESLTVLLFVLAFYRLPPYSLLSSRGTRIRDFVIALCAGATVTAVLLGVTSSQHVTPVSDFYAEASYLQAHGRNVVNVILVDFRALDTMGEVTVLATAAVGVLALLKLMKTPEEVA